MAKYYMYFIRVHINVYSSLMYMRNRGWHLVFRGDVCVREHPCVNALSLLSAHMSSSASCALRRNRHYVMRNLQCSPSVSENNRRPHHRHALITLIFVAMSVPKPTAKWPVIARSILWRRRISSSRRCLSPIEYRTRCRPSIYYSTGPCAKRNLLSVINSRHEAHDACRGITLKYLVVLKGYHLVACIKSRKWKYESCFIIKWRRRRRLFRLFLLYSAARRLIWRR